MDDRRNVSSDKFAKILENFETHKIEQINKEKSAKSRLIEVDKHSEKVQMQKLKEILRRKELGKLKQQEHYYKLQEQRELLE